MSNGDDNDEGGQNASGSSSPFVRPSFVVSAAVVALIFILGIVVVIRGLNTTNAATTPPPTSAAQESSSSAQSSKADKASSVCGLSAPTDAGPLTSGPPGSWQYEGATAYPTSSEFGPAKTASAGYRFCFQHSAAGAVFATAKALAIPTDSDVRAAWARYFLSSGLNRPKLLEELTNNSSGNTTGVRIKIEGFKILSYTGETARVDIAVEASGQAQTVIGSYVYELIWQTGDWKLNTDASVPFNFSTVPSLNDYTPWSA